MKFYVTGLVLVCYCAFLIFFNFGAHAIPDRIFCQIYWNKLKPGEKFELLGHVYIEPEGPFGWQFHGFTEDDGEISGGASNHTTKFAFLAYTVAGDPLHFITGWRQGNKEFIAYDSLMGIWRNGYWKVIR